MSQTIRIIWADALRGFLILLVVLGHSLQHGNYENNIAWNIIYSFHMATFFVISGYVGYKEIYLMSSLWGKAQQLMLPFITWTLLGALINGDIIFCFVNALLKPDTSYWFIFVLFVIITLFVTIISFCYRFRLNADKMLIGWGILLVLLMVLSEFRLFGFQFISYYFGFYVLGYILRKYNVVFSLPLVIVLGIVWCGMALFWKMHAVPVPLEWITIIPSSILTYAYRYIAALAGSMFFVGVAMKYMNVKTNFVSFFQYFGKISLGIYSAYFYREVCV